MGLDQPERARNDHDQPSFREREDGASGWNVGQIGRTYDLNVVLLRLIVRLAIAAGIFFVTGSLLNLLETRLVGDRLVSDWDALLGFLWTFPPAFALFGTIAIQPPARSTRLVKTLPRWLRWFYRDNDDYEYW